MLKLRANYKTKVENDFYRIQKNSSRCRNYSAKI